MNIESKYTRKGLDVHFRWKGKVQWRRLWQEAFFFAFLFFPDQVTAALHTLHHLW